MLSMELLGHYINAHLRPTPRRKLVGQRLASAKIFDTLCSQRSTMPDCAMIWCTEDHTILSTYPLPTDEPSLSDFIGCSIDASTMVGSISKECQLRIYNNIPGFHLYTIHLSSEANASKSLADGSHSEPTFGDRAGFRFSVDSAVSDFIHSLSLFIDAIGACAEENKFYLAALNSIKSSIAIFDKDAHIYFANRYFYNYLHISEHDGALGRHIDEVLKSNGTKIHSIETNDNRLKLHDVLSRSEAAIDWEVQVESKDGRVQVAGNDMYPIFDNDGKTIGVIELAHSRQQSIDSAKKFGGLSAEYNFKDIIGAGSAIRETIRTAKDYAASPFSLLITGESGVGKELFAQSIHNYSSRCKGPFVALNCASFPENLIESELFGYVGGAFTGASKNGQIGKFELADGGTLFLDEIGELSYHFQSKLLRVLETWRITRIGSSKPFPVNVRLIAATNRDLAQMVSDGLFRQDLYYRLQILHLVIPPLRNRGEDILQISYSILDQIEKSSGSEKKELTKEARQVMLNYSWPGNVRELRNVLYRAALFSKTDFITKDVLEASIFAGNSGAKLPSTIPQESTENISPEDRLKQRYDEVNTANINLIKEAIDIAGGNRSKAADILNISRNTFYRTLKKYNIE